MRTVSNIIKLKIKKVFVLLINCLQEKKNIIGFLYFLESLSDVEKQSDKNKVIVFDDPMNSNDDTMQYMIITEIQKLYTDKYRNKFNSQKDIFVCLTHNAHFYLNVQHKGTLKSQKL